MDQTDGSIGLDDRGPGRRPVYVLAALAGDPADAGLRLIRWDPAVLAQTSQRLEGPAYIAGPANDLIGARSWYVGVMGRHTTTPLAAWGTAPQATADRTTDQGAAAVLHGRQPV